MPRHGNREERRERLRAEIAAAKRFGPILQRVPEAEWPPNPGGPRPFEVWASRTWTVMLYRSSDEIGGDEIRDEGIECRISVRRTDGGIDISWTDLQKIKADIGRADRWACELFPTERDLVDVANLRHLWLYFGTPSFGWKKSARRS